jgi:hypothetical protein
MFRRRSTTSDSTDASAYSRRAAVADSLWAAQDRVRCGLGAAFRAAVRAPGRIFERAAFPLQERVFWPLADGAAAAGAPARAVATGAVILVAAAAGVAGLIWAAPDRPHNAAPSAEVAATAPPLGELKPPAAKPAEPTLHGAAPVFKPAKGQAASEVDPARAVVKSSPSGSSDSESSTSASSATAASSAADGPSAQASTMDGPPAGPTAIAVARDFSGAFVVYETGGSDGAVRKAFAETATAQLAKALLRRPPRLPADVQVPKAKVVNVVSAPSHGGVYPVSVSLLRVGLTSELRLEMEKLKGDGWRVTNVLG